MLELKLSREAKKLQQIKEDAACRAEQGSHEGSEEVSNELTPTRSPPVKRAKKSKAMSNKNQLRETVPPVSQLVDEAEPSESEPHGHEPPPTVSNRT